MCPTRGFLRWMYGETDGVYREGIDDRPSRWRHRAIPNAIGYTEGKNGSRVNPPGTAMRTTALAPERPAKCLELGALGCIGLMLETLQFLLLAFPICCAYFDMEVSCTCTYKQFKGYMTLYILI